MSLNDLFSPQSISRNTTAQRVADDVGAAAQTELLHQAELVGVDGLDVDVELPADLLVLDVAPSDEAQHLRLALAQLGARRLVGGRVMVQVAGDDLAGERRVVVRAAGRDGAELAGAKSLEALRAEVAAPRVEIRALAGRRSRAGLPKRLDSGGERL
jgi:hypothetical protein